MIREQLVEIFARYTKAQDSGNRDAADSAVVELAALAATSALAPDDSAIISAAWDLQFQFFYGIGPYNLIPLLEALREFDEVRFDDQFTAAKKLKAYEYEKIAGFYE